MQKPFIFRRPRIADAPYDFSFSGLKSAVLNYLNGCQMKGIEVNRADVAASFQKAVCDVLVEHAMLAVKESGLNKLAIGGGVASNGTLRMAMEQACAENGIRFLPPVTNFLHRQCGDELEQLAIMSICREPVLVMI